MFLKLPISIFNLTFWQRYDTDILNLHLFDFIMITNMNNQNCNIVHFNTLVIYASWLMAELQAQTPWWVRLMVYTKVTTVECQTEFRDLGKRHCFLFLALTKKIPENTTTYIREGIWQRKHLYRLVVQLGLQLLWIRHFPHSFHEVFLGNILAVRADGKQTCEQNKRSLFELLTANKDWEINMKI